MLTVYSSPRKAGIEISCWLISVQLRITILYTKVHHIYNPNRNKEHHIPPQCDHLYAPDGPTGAGSSVSNWMGMELAPCISLFFTLTGMNELGCLFSTERSCLARFCWKFIVKLLQKCERMLDHLDIVRGRRCLNLHVPLRGCTTLPTLVSLSHPFSLYFLGQV